MEEPWYETHGPTRKEVMTDLFECMKFKILDHRALKTIIDALKQDTEFVAGEDI